MLYKLMVEKEGRKSVVIDEQGLHFLSTNPHHPDTIKFREETQKHFPEHNLIWELIS